jgi:uncharacterized protein YdeI (YjbR/CyaY-like superfamily)
MGEMTPLFFIDAQSWNNWLAENHSRANEAWVLHYKAKSHNTGLRYLEALRVAISFGWIESYLKSIDGEKFIRRYSPIKANNFWSKRDKEEAEDLIRAGRMTEAGLRAVKAAKKNGRWK